MLKNPKGSLFSDFRHYETAIKISHFLFFRKFFKDSLLIFFQKILMSTKGSPFSLFDILQQNEW